MTETTLSFWELAILAVVQGITEFLPISSTGHLVIARDLFGVDAADDVLLDVALHIGSLFAVLLYFWTDVRAAILGPFTLIADIANARPLRWSSRLALLLVIATIPAIAFGLWLSSAGLGDSLRTVEIVGWTTLLFGILLWAGDRFGPVRFQTTDWSWGGAILLGLSQALALIPGTSRSGITMTAARFMGFSRVEAARVSMLMAVPVILAAGAKKGYDLVQAGDVQLGQEALIAAVFAFLAAYAALAVMMRMLRTISFTPFVLYRVVLGVVLLALAYAAG